MGIDIFGKAAPNQTATWEPNPTTRGSFQILSSCIITLLLCIWTALHLNVPRQYDSPPRPKWNPQGWPFRRIGTSAIWLLIGLFAPEMVAFTAWSQRREASRLKREVGRRLERHSDPAHPTDRAKGKLTQWTNTHGFYAFMGGFAISTKSLSGHAQYLPAKRNMVILSGVGVEMLVIHAPWLIPDLSAEDILDKSKASGLDKIIVCTQATWFLVQIGSRLIQRMPITLLEMNTAVHALCALVIYVLWWDKPLNVERPTLISGDRVHESCARLCQGSDIETGFGRQMRDMSEEYLKSVADGTHKLTYQGASEEDIRRDARRCLLALQCGMPRVARVSNNIPNWPVKLNWSWLRDSMTGANTVYDAKGLALAGKEDVGLRRGFGIVGAIYGGIHALAWTSPFQSPIHSQLWKISACTVMASGVYCIAGGFYFSMRTLDKTLYESANERLNERSSRCIRGVLLPMQITWRCFFLDICISSPSLVYLLQDLHGI